MKIAVIGGGSTYTPELLGGLVERAAELDLTELVLHDVRAVDELEDASRPVIRSPLVDQRTRSSPAETAVF